MNNSPTHVSLKVNLILLNFLLIFNYPPGNIKRIHLVELKLNRTKRKRKIFDVRENSKINPQSTQYRTSQEQTAIFANRL